MRMLSMTNDPNDCLNYPVIVGRKIFIFDKNFLFIFAKIFVIYHNQYIFTIQFIE